MRYFYIVESGSGQLGFGRTKDVRSRNQDYQSHYGTWDRVYFRYVFASNGAHADSLERAVMQTYAGDIESVEHSPGKKTEWFSDDVTLESVLAHVNTLIEERHFRVELIETDYHYSQGRLV